MNFSPVQVRHDSFANVTAGFLENPDDLSWSGRVPSRMDDNRATQLRLSMGRGSQHLLLALRDGPAGADLTDHAASDVCAISAVEHLADDVIRELTEMRSERWKASRFRQPTDKLVTFSDFSSSLHEQT